MENIIRNSIKTTTRILYDYQNERIALDGRLGIKKDGEIKKGIPERDETMLLYIRARRDEIMAFEQQIEKELAAEVHKHPLWKNFFVNAKGCGETMAAVIISEFDINIATTVSKLWAFAGLAPGTVRGKKYNKIKKTIIETDTLISRDRKTKGFLCPFNQFLRAKLCGVLGSSFLKCNSPYRDYYDNMKTRLEAENWGMESKNPTDKSRPKAGHQHKAATRYMVKMFLKDLYIAWRTIEGLPVREPYQEEYLGKKHTA